MADGLTLAGLVRWAMTTPRVVAALPIAAGYMILAVTLGWLEQRSAVLELVVVLAHLALAFSVALCMAVPLEHLLYCWTHANPQFLRERIRREFYPDQQRSMRPAAHPSTESRVSAISRRRTPTAKPTGKAGVDSALNESHGLDTVRAQSDSNSVPVEVKPKPRT